MSNWKESLYYIHHSELAKSQTYLFLNVNGRLIQSRIFRSVKKRRKSNWWLVCYCYYHHLNNIYMLISQSDLFPVKFLASVSQSADLCSGNCSDKLSLLAGWSKKSAKKTRLQRYSYVQTYGMRRESHTRYMDVLLILWNFSVKEVKIRFFSFNSLSYIQTFLMNGMTIMYVPD